MLLLILILILILLLVLVLHLDGQATVLVNVHLEVILCGAKGCKFNFVSLIVFLDIDSRCCNVYTQHPTCVQHIIKVIAQPIVHVTKYWIQHNTKPPNYQLILYLFWSSSVVLGFFSLPSSDFRTLLIISAICVPKGQR